MKAMKCALLAVVLTVSLTGCSSSKFAKIDDPIVVGDKVYTALFSERVQPWGANAVSLHLIETEINNQVAQQAPKSTHRNAPPQMATRTHVATVNNQGSTGWVNGALQGTVGSAIQGGCMIGAAAAIRPSRTTVNGGNASANAGANSCSSASAAAISQ